MNEAPRAVMLALFWLTSWGQQWANVDAFNDAQAQRQLANAFRRRNDELEKQIAHLARIADFGAANDPSPSALLRRPEIEPARARPSRKIHSPLNVAQKKQNIDSDNLMVLMTRAPTRF
jgi:hypothetical protein